MKMVARTDDVIREDLLRRLPAATDEQQLVIVAAPGGWGKSTMLDTWQRWAVDTRFMWCSMSASDNDTNRFINRLVDTATKLIGHDVDWPDPSESTPMVWVEKAVPLMAEALSAAGPTVIVLDDYHLVESSDTHGVVQALVERIGRDQLLVLSTRADPPLKLARLRAARAVTELRSEDLQFSAEDTELMLRQTFDLDLTRHQVEQLVDSTEGWPAAISLAAQSLRTVNDVEEFLGRFVSSDRLIVDYLAEELLETLPADHRGFLHDTSVVEMFVPDLATALVGAKQPTSSSSQIGEDLERQGLLRRHYESNRVWFHYHQLLREFLYRRLDPEERRGRHRIAADWFEANSQPRRAIEQLTAAGEVDRVADLIQTHAGDYILRGRNATVLRWVDNLAQRTDVGTGLALLGAQAALYDGRIEVGQAWLAKAEANLEPSTAERLLGLHLRSVEAAAEGRIADGAALAERLLDLYESDGATIDLDPSAIAECLFIAAVGIAMVGDTERARWWLDQVSSISVGGQSRAPRVAAVALKACLAFVEGDLATSTALADDAIAEAADIDLGPTTLHMMVVHVAVSLTRGGHEARQSIAYLHEINEYLYSMQGLAIGHLGESYVWLREGEIDAADRALVAARDVISEFAQPSPLVDRILELVSNQHPVLDLEEPPGPSALTARELQVLRAFSSNLTQREIGRELFLSFNTIKTYARSAYRKLGVASRSEAVKACREAGLF